MKMKNEKLPILTKTAEKWKLIFFHSALFQIKASPNLLELCSGLVLIRFVTSKTKLDI